MSKRHRGQAAKEHGFSDLWRRAAIFLLKDSQTTETSMPTWTITQIIVMKAERGYSEIAWVTISTCTCHRLEFKISVLNNRHVMKGKERRAMCKHSFPRPSPKNNQQAIQLIPADVTGKTGKVFVRGFLSPGHGSFLWSCPAFLGHRVGWLHSRVLRLVTYGG